VQLLGFIRVCEDINVVAEDNASYKQGVGNALLSGLAPHWRTAATSDTLGDTSYLRLKFSLIQN
jgi:hypothetical protein